MIMSIVVVTSTRIIQFSVETHVSRASQREPWRNKKHLMSVEAKKLQRRLSGCHLGSHFSIPLTGDLTICNSLLTTSRKPPSFAPATNEATDQTCRQPSHQLTSVFSHFIYADSRLESLFTEFCRPPFINQQATNFWRPYILAAGTPLLTIPAEILCAGPYEDPHRGEALHVPLDWLRLQVLPLGRAHQAQEEAPRPQALHLQHLWASFQQVHLADTV